MKRSGSLKAIGTFCFRFAMVGPVCLLAWWLIMPLYVWLIGQLSGGILVHGAGMTIDALRVATDAQGVLNTRTTLTFYSGSGQRVIEIAFIVNNLPPFVILILATAGLETGRRIRALIAGSVVLATLHIAFVVLAYRYSDAVASHPEIPQALGKFMLTLPFVLWIALAYWPKITELIEEGHSTAGKTGRKVK